MKRVLGFIAAIAGGLLIVFAVACFALAVWQPDNKEQWNNTGFLAGVLGMILGVTGMEKLR